MTKPVTHQADLARLPRALAPLTEREQWAVWRWTQKPDGSWQKPPYQARDPQRHASTNNSDTWTDFATALAAVKAGHADGLTYVLTADDPYAAIDLDHCRDTLGGIDIWAQLFLERGRDTYSEVTPSGAGCRIWGLASGMKLHRKFDLVIDDKPIAAELFRCTNKALTITGYALDTLRELTNIDKLLDWAVAWGERRRAAATSAEPVNGNGSFSSNGCGYSVDQIEHIVCAGPPQGANRSDLFHAIIGHYLGCGWDAERIFAHLEQHPYGISERYLREGRLAREIERSISKYGTAKLPLLADWTSRWEAKAPQPEPQTQEPVSDDLELQDDLDGDDMPNAEQPPTAQDDQPNDPGDEDLGDDHSAAADDDALDDKELSEGSVNLPPMFAHGDPDPRPLKRWMIKRLIPVCGHGLLSGQWGTGKTFMALELGASVMTGQPFLGHLIKRQCGVLFIAAEGAADIRLRLNAVVQVKCGGMQRAPFRWYEAAPVLLRKGTVETLVAMAKQADASLQQEFGMPLGLIFIDTITASAGYSQPGAENDNGVGQHLMNVLKTVGETLDCFVIGIDHYGKNIGAGTRGAYSKEASGDLVLVCLGDKELSGRVINTRLVVRKNRQGPQGQEVAFTLREVTTPELDEDGEATTTMVVDWQSAGAGGAQPQPEPDPWSLCRRQDQRTAVLRLKRVLMTILADRGVDLPAGPNGPVVRMVDQELVRVEYHAHTPVDGTAEQKRKARHMQFSRALAWAEDRQLIGAQEIDGVTYLWLTRPDPQSDDAEQD